jgi:hypothetical protein
MIGLATTAIAWIVCIISVVGWVVYYFANRNSARPEIGSEIELAPNRKPYYDDETLEGPRLERVMKISVLLLASMVIGLAVYWVLEPGRQAGATSGRRAASPSGVRRCSRPLPTVASTAPAVTAA